MLVIGSVLIVTIALAVTLTRPGAVSAFSRVKVEEVTYEPSYEPTYMPTTVPTAKSTTSGW